MTTGLYTECIRSGSTSRRPLGGSTRLGTLPTVSGLARIHREQEVLPVLKTRVHAALTPTATPRPGEHVD